MSKEELAPFEYQDRGTMATIGRSAAVARVFGRQITGFVAWFLWLVVHIFYLMGFRSRLIVLINWAYSYFAYHPGVRIIVGLRRERDPRLAMAGESDEDTKSHARQSMDYSEFLGQVQQRARLGTQEEAVRATRATLQTLGQRLAGGEPNNLAAQLPNEIGRYLKDTSSAAESVRFGVDEFFDRVRAHMGQGTDRPDAVFYARVVLSVLKEAISPGEWHDMKAQLPEEYEDLLESGWTGELGDTNVIDEGRFAQRDQSQPTERESNRDEQPERDSNRG